MNESLSTYCPTYEALSIIYGSMESEANIFKSFLRTGVMMESDLDNDVVMEGVSDIFKTIVTGIKKFIQRVKDFFKKILLYITSSYQDLDKLSNEVKKVIENKTDIKFEVDGYRFTVMDKNGPNTKEFTDIVSKYNEDMANITKLKESEIIKDIMDWLNPNNLDKLRGQVLGINNSIPEDEFLDNVREYYRNGMKETEKFTVTRTTVDEIINHSKRIEELKRSSIKDRDQLITLLSKTESFFNRTIYTYYNGNEKEINVNKVDISDGKFRTENNKVTVNDNTSKIISKYATYKAKQVNKIASMINLVACERVNALKDQIQQERMILKKCLFGDTTEKKSDDSVNESLTVFPNTGYKGTDYSILAMESNIQDFRIYEGLSRATLLNEARFILESINSGEVHYLMEVDNKLGNKVKNTISDIIEAIVNHFRRKAIGDTDKYKPWLDDIKDGLKDKAKVKKELSMANFIDSNYTNMAKQIQTAISTAYKSTKYEDVSFASSIISNIKSIDDLSTPETRTLLLNYFRTGKVDEKLATKTMNGAELAGKVDGIVKYLETYGTAVVGTVNSIKKTLQTATDGFKVTESMISGDTYLDIISAPVCESDVVLCKDYNKIFNQVTETYLMEADIGGDGKTAIAGEANASIKSSTKAVNDEAKNGKDIKGSATSVTSSEEENADDKNGINEKKTNSAAVSYKRNIDNFFKYCISLYLKAREEQFLAYINVLCEIDGKRPKFDNNGIYVRDTNDTSKEVTKTESK